MKDGTSFPVEYVSTPISERRELSARSSSSGDTTDRKRAEAQLQDSLRRLRKLSGRMEGSERSAAHRRGIARRTGVGLTCLKIDLSRLGGLLGERLVPAIGPRSMRRFAG